MLRFRARACLVASLLAIGSGGAYAQAAARAMLDTTELGAREIVERGLQIAGDICVYTNQNHSFEAIDYSK